MRAYGTDDPRTRWEKIHAQAGDELPMPARVLRENLHLLPERGHALDLACGLGGNALFLARYGLSVEAVDFSLTAIERLNGAAQRFGFPITGHVLDLDHEPLPDAQFDVVVVSRFLSRDLVPAIIGALKPGGLLFYQTFTTEKLSESGPKNPEFLLAANELLHLFSDLRLVVYREEGRIGDIEHGFRDEALLVGQRRPPADASAS